MNLLFFLFSYLFSTNIILVDDFNSYKNTTDFLKNWKSRSSNYKKILEENSYYYFINDTNKEDKFLCSALRFEPLDYKRADIKNIKTILDNKDIKSVSMYKDYWDKRFYIGSKYHKKEKEVYLNWDWIAYLLPDGADNEIKEKADNAISIYVVFYHSWMNFKTLKYVWSSTNKLGPVKAFLDHKSKREIVVDNKESYLKKWISKSINISNDIKTYWPDIYNEVEIIAVAVMSDSDNLKKPSYACVNNISIEIKDTSIKAQEKVIKSNP